MRSPIVWMGGKGLFVKHLLPLIPEHITYVEPFGGGASLLFAKPLSKVEVYNDIDSGLVSFFRVLRDEEKAEKLIRLLKLTLYSREEYYDCRQTWEEQQDEIEKVRRWFVVNRQSIGGMFGRGWGFGIGSRGLITQKWTNSIDGLLKVVNRFRKVQVEHYDFRKIFKIYDTPETLFYVDPWYVQSVTRGNNCPTKYELTNEDHNELIDILLQIEGMAIVSGYNHSIYNKLNWERKDYSTVCHATARTKVSGLKGEGKVSKQQKRTESIWLSPNAVQNRVRTQRLF